MDDTINIPRKSNLSTEYDPRANPGEDIDFEQEMQERYGAQLISFFRESFEDCMYEGVYVCNKNKCQMPYLKSLKGDGETLELSDKDILKQRFSHSFRYSSNMMNQDKIIEFETAQAYLKDVIKSNISTKD
jgi:hypothetical protein